MAYKRMKALDLFSELTPSELAVLWLSSGPEFFLFDDIETNINITQYRVQVNIPRYVEKQEPVRYFYSKGTHIFGCLLAEGYAKAEGNIKEYKAHDLISKYVKKILEDQLKNKKSSFSFLSLEKQINKFLKLIPKDSLFQLGKDVESSEDLVFRQCNNAMKSLQDKGLIIDPPWLQGFGFGITTFVILLGSIPMNFSIRTEKGENLVKQVIIRAPFWRATYENRGNSKKFEFNQNITKFVIDGIRYMAREYLKATEKNFGSGKQENPNKQKNTIE